MKWNNEIVINAPIDAVWTVLTDASYTSRTMPKLVSSKLVEEKPELNIKIYEDVYKEGNRSETYLLTLTTLTDEATQKEQKFEFTIANMISTVGYYTLTQLDENTTRFIYRGENTGANFMGRVMMFIAKFFANDKESVEYIERVKYEAENNV